MIKLVRITDNIQGQRCLVCGLKIRGAMLMLISTHKLQDLMRQASYVAAGPRNLQVELQGHYCMVCADILGDIHEEVRKAVDLHQSTIGNDNDA